FPDDTQVSVNGLDETMADLYSEGRQANQETAAEIIKRLEVLNNYVPSSDRTRKEYAYVLLKGYREYVQGRADSKPEKAIKTTESGAVK
ncbi:MAG: hypothetical protein NT140_06575, partial [Deltaproteobacteria bacterium]|nr:hypothetical protein [Deltaproteobacteria bacterium]